MNTIDSLVALYIAAWNEPAPQVRRQLLEEVWTEDGQYTDRLVHAEGRTNLDTVIADFLTQFSGTCFSLFGSVDHHHQFVRFAWQLKLSDGSTLNGIDFGERALDGRFCRIVGFF